MRLGVTEVRRDNNQGGLFAGAGLAGVELIIALILSPFVVFFLGYAVYLGWPDWDKIIAVGLLAVLIGVGLLWLLLALGFRAAGVFGAFNRGRAIHTSDMGATFVHGGLVHTHSHNTDTLPPINEDEPEDEYDDYGPVNLLAATGRKPPKTYGDMVRTGLYGHPDAGLVLAFEDNGTPIGLPNLTSIGIGGVQGSGKTVTAFVLMLQIIAKYNGKVKFLVVDPQLYAQSNNNSLSSKVQELSPFFLRVPGMNNPTVGTGELKAWMEFIAKEQKRRLDGGDWQDVWVLVVDEFAHIMTDPERAEAALPVLRSINSLARQLDIFAILISYEWLARIMDGTELRHAIATFAIHNMTESVASLLVPSDAARQAPKLRPGQVLFYSLGRTRIGRVPLATDTDARAAVVRYGPGTVDATSINRGQAEYVDNRFEHLQLSSRGYEASNASYVPEATTISPQAYQALYGESIPDTVQGEVIPMPPLAELDRLPGTNQGDGLPMGIDTQVAREIQEAYLEGLSVSDTATRVLGSRSEGNTFKVRETLKWLVGHGLR